MKDIGEVECVGYDMYNTTCRCCDSDHTLTFSFFGKEQTDIARLELYNKLEVTSWWPAKTILGQLYNRVKLALRILVHGHLDANGEFLFRGPKQLRAVANLLNNMADRIEPLNMAGKEGE